MLRKVAYAGSQSASFVQATKDLIALAETKVSRERVQRWTKRVGEERVAEAERQAEAYQALPLPEQQKSPTDQLPQVVCVMMDGGRIQVRDRHENEPNTQGYWKESLVGCCLSMVSEEQLRDPCPTIPKTFVDPQRMHDLSREIKGSSASTEGAAAPSAEFPDDRHGRPEVLVRSVVATRGGQEVFGKRLVAEAHSRGFHAARRRRSWPMDRPATGRCIENTSRTTPRSSILRTRSATCTPRQWPGEAAQRHGTTTCVGRSGCGKVRSTR